jgi:hypothetical protein
MRSSLPPVQWLEIFLRFARVEKKKRFVAEEKNLEMARAGLGVDLGEFVSHLPKENAERKRGCDTERKKQSSLTTTTRCLKLRRRINGIKLERQSKEDLEKREATAKQGEEWEDGLSSGRTMVHSGRGYCSSTSAGLGGWDDWTAGQKRRVLGIFGWVWSGIGEGRRRL